MTIEDVYFIVADTRCAHGRLTLENAERTAGEWVVYLRDPAHPCAYQVRDYHAYQAYAPALPTDWIVPRTCAERIGPDAGATPGTITLPELTQILVADTDSSPWQLHAIHHAATATDDVSYVVEALNISTQEVRTIPTVAAYRHMHQCGARANDEAGASWRETRYPDGSGTRGASSPVPARGAEGAEGTDERGEAEHDGAG
jgi:hypothetical protein